MYPSSSADFALNPQLIKQMLYLDRPDVVVTAGEPARPVVGVEVTAEAMSGHDAFQRFARIVAAAEFGTPFAYIFPRRKWVRREASERWDECNPLIFEALLRVTRIHNVPCLAFIWDADHERGNRNEGYLWCHGRSCLPSPRDPEFQAMARFIDLALRFRQENRPCLEMLNTEFFFERERLMWGWFHERGGQDTTWSPLTACHYLDTADLPRFVWERAAGAVLDLPEHLAAREGTWVYTPHTRTFRSDPYAGCLVALDYLQCRTGPTTEHRHSNLVVHFPELSVESVVAKGQRYHKQSCALQYPAPQASANRLYGLHLREGCRYTKQKEIRIICSFADVVIFNDGVLV